MDHQVLTDNTSARDFIPIFSGHECCEKNHRYGPFVRDYYLIHFCLNGKGKLFDKYGEHKIGAGELFIIRPEEVTTYVADEVTPWEYSWLAFEGNLAGDFATDRSVYPFPLDIGTLMRELVEKDDSTPSIYISILFRLHYLLFHKTMDEPYNAIEKIKQYIRVRYMDDLSINQISHEFGFERSYLYRLFQRNCGMGLKEFLIKTRMEQARLLLQRGHGVGETAYAVGYKDPFNFSKTYKSYFDISPKDEKTH